MKSTCANTKLVLALAAGFLGLGCGVAIAQQKQVIVSDDTSVKASIPIKNASISADGHVEVKCAQNPCPAMGGGTGISQNGSEKEDITLRESLAGICVGISETNLGDHVDCSYREHPPFEKDGHQR